MSIPGSVFKSVYCPPPAEAVDVPIELLFLFLPVAVQHDDSLNEDKDQEQYTCCDLAPPGEQIAVESNQCRNR